MGESIASLLMKTRLWKPTVRWKRSTHTKKHYIVASVLTAGLVLKLITDNHDLQYRHWWKPDDIVIWDKYAALVSLILFWMQANRRVQPHRSSMLVHSKFPFQIIQQYGCGISNIINSDLTNEERLGYRVTSLTGKFYCDPTSLSREEGLRKERMANSST